MTWPLNGVISTFQDYPSLSFMLVFGTVYGTYYFRYVCKKPLIACGDKKFENFLLRHCPMLREKYWPTVWCFESRAQTILRSLLQSCPHVSYQTEVLRATDGGRIKIDWLESDEIYPSSQPTILILPGLTGNSQESYALHLVKQAASLGYRSVVFNYRGSTSEDKLLTPRTYCATDTEDLATVLMHIKNRHPTAPLVGVGISLGGMILMSYLVKQGANSGFMAAMAMSAAWNVFESSKALEQPLNNILFNRYLANNLVSLVRKNIDLFDSHFDMDSVLKSQTIKEFDDRFTSKLFGYSSGEDYYKEACLHNKVHLIETPLLCLNAADDPFSPSHAIPVSEAQETENIAIVVTSHGGHIGFLEGLFPRHTGYMDRLFMQYIDAIFKYGQAELKKD